MVAELGFDEPLIPATSVVQLLDRLREYCGIRPELLLPGTAINPQLLLDSRARISPRQHIALLRNARSSGMPADFGLVMAADFDIVNYGLLGYAMMSAATLHQSIDIALRYYKTAGPTLALAFDVHGDRAELLAQDIFGLGELLPFAVDSLFASLPRLLGWLTGRPIHPLDVPNTGAATRSVFRSCRASIVPTIAS